MGSISDKPLPVPKAPTVPNRATYTGNITPRKSPIPDDDGAIPGNTTKGGSGTAAPSSGNTTTLPGKSTSDFETMANYNLVAMLVELKRQKDQPSGDASAGNKNSPEAIRKAQEEAEHDAHVIQNGRIAGRTEFPTSQQKAAAKDRFKENASLVKEIDGKPDDSLLRALENGENVKLDAATIAYLKRFNESLPSTVSGLEKFLKESPDIAGSVSDSHFLLSSNQVKYLDALGSEQSGSINNLPNNIATALTEPDIKSESHFSIFGRSRWSFDGKNNGPGTQRDFTMKNGETLRKLTQIYQNSTDSTNGYRYRNGSDISRSMIARSGEIAWAERQRELDANVRLYSAPTTGPERYQGYKEVNEDYYLDTAADMLKIVGDDHNASVDALAGDNMLEGYDGGTIDNLLNASWNGRDVNGEISGEKKMNPEFGLNKVFAQINSFPERDNTQKAANSFGKLLSSGKYAKLGETNPGVTQALAQGFRAYHANFAGYIALAGIQPMQKSAYVNLLKAMYSDPIAGVETTDAIMTQEALLAQNYGAGRTNASTADIAGQMHVAMVYAVSNVAADATARDRYNKILELAKNGALWDTTVAALSSATGIAGKVPGPIGTVGKVGDIGLKIANPLVKIATLGALNPADVETPAALRNTLNYVATIDNSHTLDAAIVQGLAEKHPEILSDPELIKYGWVKDGVIQVDTTNVGFRHKMLEIMGKYGKALVQKDGEAIAAYEQSYDVGKDRSTFGIVPKEYAENVN
ncbi:hypothetical protein GOEFS_039_00070 [Gordonia effusa NBRC 100432]|uniref:TPR repeat domain-containing protein n=1 Tax=Gordonia effusa NBRC 100432 TaxID=1077974 RepID=H0QY72_9ACTN|nr:hypothetical protein [Gordonia effusa]GAB17773.1 hypothetical protein GOEFS_039_00070 [Gordonia effusa NBRC 100432]